VSKYAVIRDGGRQYTVREGDRVLFDRKPAAKSGDAVKFDQVLLLGGTGDARVGAPTVTGAAVLGKVLAEEKGEKVVAFKRRRRKNSKSKKGHRQKYTAVRIEKIEG